MRTKRFPQENYSILHHIPLKKKRVRDGDRVERGKERETEPSLGELHGQAGAEREMMGGTEPRTLAGEP